MDIFMIYGPILSSITLLFFAWRKEFDDKPVLSIQKFGFEFVVTQTVGFRVVFLSTILVCLLPYYLYIDYTKFFPSHFEMEVFYDNEGIEKTLSIFSSEELSSLGYKVKDTALVKDYYQSLDKKLHKALSYDGFFSLDYGVVHSEGETSFKVTKIRGIHNYHIDESEGKLRHILDAPGQTKIEFLSFFDKIPSSSDYIRPSFAQILFDHELVLSPRYKQIVAEKNRSDGVVFDHALIGVTKVYLLPYPSFSDTVYFYDVKGKGIVPIGYGVYK